MNFVIIGDRVQLLGGYIPPPPPLFRHRWLIPVHAMQCLLRGYEFCNYWGRGQLLGGYIPPPPPLFRHRWLIPVHAMPIAYWGYEFSNYWGCNY